MTKRDNVDSSRRSRGEPPTLQKSKLAYTTHQAGEAIGKSPTWMRQRRLDDLKLLEMGAAPVGPPWRVDAGGNIVYLAEALRAWLLRSTTEFGRSRFRGHGTEEVGP
jgi:hypothetical protein